MWRGRLGQAPVVACAIAVALLSLLPFGFVAWVAIQTGWERGPGARAAAEGW